MQSNKPDQWSECLYGIATMGERGQIVIPIEARKKMGLTPGEKIIILSHPSEAGLVLFKADTMREFMTAMLEKLNHTEANSIEPNFSEANLEEQKPNSETEETR